VEIIPTWHRAYVRSHRLGICVSLGILVGGLINLLTPELVEESAPVLVLPRIVLLIFNLTWVVGGALSAIGALRGARHIEIPGLSLVAGGLLAYYVTAITVRSTTALTAIFIALLAVGFAGHAINLYLNGYDGEVRR